MAGLIEYSTVKRINQIFCALLAALAASLSSADDTIRQAADLTRTLMSPSLSDPKARPLSFDLSGLVMNCANEALILSDHSGGALVLTHALTNGFTNPSPGDRIRITGEIVPGDVIKIPTASCLSITLIEHGKPPTPTAVTGSDFASGRFDYRLVTLCGRVLDVVNDEIYAKNRFLILECDGERICCPVSSFLDKGTIARTVLGRLVEVQGICQPAPSMSRLMIGRVIYMTEPPQFADSEVIDPFSAPELSNCRLHQPKDMATFDRHKLRGRVLAVWAHAALIRTGDGLVARIDFRDDDLPRYGQMIEAVGLPETDIYMPILRRALWRDAGDTRLTVDEKPIEQPFSSIFQDKDGNHRIDSLAQGKLIRTVAKVRSLPSGSGPINYMYIGTDEFALPVDISSADPWPKGLAVDSTVEITGIYLVENQPWRPNVPIPPIDSVRLIVRSANDIRILSTPSWWTAGRLLVVVGILGAGLLFVIAWNLALQRVAERRGRKLSEERIARAEAEIKTMERTRLAVELHDTIAQNLTGVSIALDTARQFCQAVRPELAQQIDVADATLDSCQTELRNCLWDLRNQALEEADLNTAIRTALQPHVTDAALDIRFNVDRSRLTENTAHAILRIIRELVINAVRHGHATHIQIAGAIDPDALRFSVRDNGSGFDAENCPGIAQKHFGLQGIRERLSLLGGKITIESKHGSGTRVVVAISLHDYQDPSS